MSKNIKKIAFFSIFIFILLSIFLLRHLYSSAPTSAIPANNKAAWNQPPLAYNNSTNNQLLETEDQNEQIEKIDSDPILVVLDQMTLDEKIGQLFILGFDGLYYEDAEQLHAWMNEYYIGNFIVFKRNIQSEEQLADLIESIDTHNNSEIIPIWIGIDQEGGVVNRLPTKYSSAEQFSKWDDTVITYTKHSEMAKHLKRLGIDINFGPVLDINSNPNNLVINSRAFGRDATAVSKHTTAVINAYNDEQIFAVGKHFPGHGDTNDDSHYKLPVISKSWDELLEMELIPFQNAIVNDIPSIMVGHLLIKEIDDTLPASLSQKVVEQKLVNELGFEGIIMTDDLIMDGILKHHSISEAVVLALKAGDDMIIIGHEPAKQEEAIVAVKEAIANHELSLAEIDKKVYKILKYKLMQ